MMKIFLIILSILIIYLVMAFVTFVLVLYNERQEWGSATVYDHIDEDDMYICLLWPITIWFIIGYLLYFGAKKYAIALCELIYQIKHPEDEDDEQNR